MRVLMVFVDGVGIGKKDGHVNPFFAAPLPAFSALCGGELPSLRRRATSSPVGIVLPLDATLGVPGLPQSGTGQAALFTGVNAPRAIGKHFGPFPFSTLRPMIAEKNVFRSLRLRGLDPCFANAYPARYFEYMEKHPSRMTVTPFAALRSGLPLRTIAELREGTGISADLTGKGWHALGHPELPVITPQKAGERLVRLLDRHPFVLFEYWKTDHAGHSQKMEEALEALVQLDGLIEGIMASLDHRRDLLLLTSDHGNLEDLSVKGHTRNPVPAIIAGHRHAEVARAFERRRSAGGSIRDVTPILLELLKPAD